MGSNYCFKVPKGIDKVEPVFSLKGFTVTVVKLWHRVLGEVVEAPPLGMLRMENAGLRWPCFEQKAGLDDLQR